MKGLAAIIGCLIFLILLLGGGYMFYKHSGFFQFEHNPLRWMPDMHQTLLLKPQRSYSFYENYSGARVPPEGVVARDQLVYRYPKELHASEAPKLKNQLKVSMKVVKRGQQVYNSYCIVCHGADGSGDGSVVGPFPNPPSLHSKKIREYEDSQIFHVITRGQNIMGSYASQIRRGDRWAVIHYIRALQLAENPSEDDLKAFDQVIANTEAK